MLGYHAVLMLERVLVMDHLGLTTSVRTGSGVSNHLENGSNSFHCIPNCIMGQAPSEIISRSPMKTAIKDWDSQKASQIVTQLCGFVTILSGTFLLHRSIDMAQNNVPNEPEITSETNLNSDVNNAKKGSSSSSTEMRDDSRNEEKQMLRSLLQKPQNSKCGLMSRHQRKENLELPSRDALRFCGKKPIKNRTSGAHGAKISAEKDWDSQKASQIVTQLCGFVTILSGTFLLHRSIDMAQNNVPNEPEITSETNLNSV
ncbi:hypothetical protein Scep_010634 [Stephania cephalantha]|uniref:Probable magnesium transporter n=1 Tax=Stephania cephalantha TaxID=152367 RepID=A0AAP0JVF5_9MAGN